MRAPTHIAFGCASYFFVKALFNSKIEYPFIDVYLCMFGSILPDIDLARSTVGRFFWFISRPIERNFGHRTITHSFLALFVVVPLISLLLGWVVGDLLGGGNKYSLSFAFWFGYFSHLLIDTVNKEGITFLAPFSYRYVFVLPRNRDYRVKVGSAGEITIFIISSIIALFMFPIASVGLNRTIHYITGDPGLAREDFVIHSGKRRTYLRGEFRDNLTGELIRDRLYVVDIAGSNGFIVLHNGTLRYASRESDSDLYIIRSFLELGEPVKITSKIVDMSGKTLGDLHEIVKGKEHYISGELIIYDTDLKVPKPEGKYPVFYVSNGRAVLDHARYKDFSEFSNILVKKGHVVIQFRGTPILVAQNERSPLNSSGSGGHSTIVFEVISSEDIKVKEGQFIRAGDIVAVRSQKKAKLEEVIAKLEAKKKLIENLKRIRQKQAQIEAYEDPRLKILEEDIKKLRNSLDKYTDPLIVKDILREIEKRQKEYAQILAEQRRKQEEARLILMQLEKDIAILKSEITELEVRKSQLEKEAYIRSIFDCNIATINKEYKPNGIIRVVILCKGDEHLNLFTQRQ